MPFATSSTLPTPTSSVALPETVTPFGPTSVPDVGDESDTDGGVASGQLVSVPARAAFAASRIAASDDFGVSSA